eukprot:1874364-Rhodomonas_salina.1
MRDSANARSSALLLDVAWTMEVPGTVAWSSHVTVVPSLAHTRRKPVSYTHLRAHETEADL